jgi:hypothetical protein
VRVPAGGRLSVYSPVLFLGTRKARLVEESQLQINVIDIDLEK